MVAVLLLLLLLLLMMLLLLLLLLHKCTATNRARKLGRPRHVGQLQRLGLRHSHGRRGSCSSFLRAPPPELRMPGGKPRRAVAGV